MQSRTAKWIVVIALILSVGGHWGILRVTAWIGMTVSYSQSDSLGTALVKTFNGKNPCKLCKFVTEGEKAERKAEAKLDLKKIDFFTLTVSEFHFPALQQHPVGRTPALLLRPDAPPTPPPLLG